MIIIVGIVVLLNLPESSCGCSAGGKKNTTVSRSDDEFEIIVETEYGQVRGHRNETLLEKLPYYSFKGIPYGRPPIGELRFKV